jgi:D-glycero-D-manno-heptose 1,7-bisphosphate phosphatase
VTARPDSGVKPAVFLDRDGTMIEDVGYLDRLDQIAFYPWTIDAVRALNRAGLPVVVITNQSGIARGIFSEAFVDETHRAISAQMDAGGARVDAYYYCPHHPRGTVERYAVRCDCRKPGAALIHRAARDLGLDPSRSFMVGDKWLDVGAARAAGARAILVRTGLGAIQEARGSPNLTPDAIVDNLAAAVSWILLNPHSAIRNPQC